MHNITYTGVMFMAKLRRNVTIDEKLLAWVDEEIEKKRFASLSHAIEQALYQLKHKARTYNIKES